MKIISGQLLEIFAIHFYNGPLAKKGKPMLRSFGIILLMLTFSGFAFGEVGPEEAQKLYDRVSPSLVGVQYIWDSERGRQEVIGSGVLVSEDGLVMASLGVFDVRIPDQQMKEFKIIVPRQDDDNEELEASFLGRDERTNLAFLKIIPSREWKAVQFEDVPLKIGEPILSVGVLPKAAGYRTYLTQATVAATLRGEIPQVLVSSGGLAGVGSPVFNAEGKAVGFVNIQIGQTAFLNVPGPNALHSVLNPPHFFVPTRDFQLSLQDTPTADQPIRLPWIGVPQLIGLKQDTAEFFGLENQPAVEVGDVIPNTPADKAGLKRGQIIVKMNGQPLERGDQPEELGQILQRKIIRTKIGSEVTFSVLPAKGQPLEEITVTLEEQPKRANLAERFYAEDLGFTVREIVFADTYVRRLPPDSKGVVVALVREQSSAQSAQLKANDLITELNGQPVADLDQFKQAYEEFRKEKPQEAVVMVVMREAKQEIIRIEPPQ